MNEDGSSYSVSSCTLLIFEPGRIQLYLICHSWYLNQDKSNFPLSSCHSWYLNEDGSNYILSSCHSWYLNQDGSNYILSSSTLLIFEPGRIQLYFIFMYTPVIWTRTDPIMWYLHVHFWYLNQNGFNLFITSDIRS